MPRHRGPPVPSPPWPQLSASITSATTARSGRSIVQAQAPQRRGPCRGHHVPGLAPALARAPCATIAHLALAPAARPGPLHLACPQRHDLLRSPVARYAPDFIRESGGTIWMFPCRAASLATAFSDEDGDRFALASGARQGRCIRVSGDSSSPKPARRSCSKHPRAARGKRRASIGAGPVACPSPTWHPGAEGMSILGGSARPRACSHAPPTSGA